VAECAGAAVTPWAQQLDPVRALRPPLYLNRANSTPAFQHKKVRLFESNFLW
jgi:hypothetical protein